MSRMLSLPLQDACFSLFWGTQKGQEAVMVSIDQESLKEFQQWPFPRILHAVVQKHLIDAGAKTVAWDFMFLGRDKSSPESIKKMYSQILGHDILLKTDIDKTFDEIFTHSLKNNGIVGYVPQHLIKNEYCYKDIANGHIFGRIDHDDKIRSVELTSFSDGKAVPSLSLYTAVLYTDQQDAFKIGFQSRGRYLSTTETIPLRRWQFPTISYRDIYNNTFDKNIVQGKAVFISPSDISLNDIKNYPWGHEPGTVSHICAFEELLNGPVTILPRFYAAFLGFLVGTLFFFLVYKASCRKVVCAGIFLLLFGFACSYCLAVGKNIYLDGVPTVLSVISIMMFIIICSYLDEHKKILRIQRYIAPEIANVLMESNQDNPYLEGKERNISVLFSDLRGFTSLTEHLHPRQVQKLLNGLFTPFSRIIQEHQGIVDKYVGDEVMAVWNAPLDVINHQQKTLTAAFAMLASLPSIEKALPPDILQGRHLRCGIGINCGLAFVGDMGAEHACSYTSLGKTVNLASRIEHACPEYGQDILVSEEFSRHFTDWTQYRFLLIDIIYVKGIELPQALYRPILYDNGNLEMVEAVEGWLEMERLFREGLITDAWRRGEESLKNGWFQEFFKQENPDSLCHCPQMSFLENILGRHQMWLNGKTSQYLKR